MSLIAVSRNQAAGRSSQDRVDIFRNGEDCWLVLADGAGGSGGSAQAAQAVLDAIEQQADCIDSIALCELLLRVDGRLHLDATGETTAVAVHVRGDRVSGASVGDSAAWLIDRAGQITDMTGSQRRKPLLGSGEALPIAFGPVPLRGRLLLGSDGLFNYATAARIADVVTNHALETAAERLIDAVRLPSGTLQDDVSIALAELG
ncbi:MAG TPA: hypothetical protein VM847_02590 [Tahibacter sp.]|nr:hypothetical protein [Tahibacter sp.]